MALAQGWSNIPNINHLLEVFLHLFIKPWWNPPTAFFDWLGPLLQGYLTFYY